MPEKPVKGMAVAIALYPDGHTDDPENPGAKFYFAGDDPNRPEHRPQYGEAPAPTPTPTPTPTVSPKPTPTVAPTPAGKLTPAVTPTSLPTPKDQSGSPVKPGVGDHPRAGRPGAPATHGGNTGSPIPGAKVESAVRVSVTGQPPLACQPPEPEQAMVNRVFAYFIIY